MVYFKYFFLPLVSVAKNRHQPERQCWLLGEPVLASIAKGKCERQDGPSWFPVNLSLLLQAGLGFLFRPLGTLLVPCASVDLTAHLSIEPLEQDPAFTQLSPESLAESLRSDAEDKEGRRKEGTEDKGWAHASQLHF